MVRCLDDGEKVGVPFFWIVRAMCAGSSKKRAEDTLSQYD